MGQRPMGSIGVQPDADKKTFEEMLRELEMTVQELERGELPLEDSIKKFKAGMHVANVCNKMLSEAELEVKKIIEEGGRIREDEFEEPAQ